MKKCLIIILLFSLGLSKIFAQESKAIKFGLNYSLIFNNIDIVTVHEVLVDYKLTHSLSFILNKDMKNKSKVLYGLNYQYLYGDSEIENYQIYSCSTLITFSKYYEKRQNVFQLFIGYQFKPFNQKENVLIRLFAQPGFSSEKAYIHYNPEIGCQGYFNTINKVKNLSSSGGISILNKIYLGKRFLIYLNTGLNYQFIENKLGQLNFFSGIEFAF